MRQWISVVDLLGFDLVAVVTVCNLPPNTRRFGPESVESQWAVLRFQTYVRCRLQHLAPPDTRMRAS